MADEKNVKSGRVFNIVQYENNPKTGESLNFTEQNIIDAVEGHTTIKRYAYICHDDDHYTKDEVNEQLKKLNERYDDIRNSSQLSREEYISENQTAFEGKLKPLHWHIVLEVPGKTTVANIAKWLGIPENMVKVPKSKKGGMPAFLDCVEYLTHSAEKQQKMGKTLYDDELVQSNFDWRQEIIQARDDIEKFGKVLSLKDKLRYETLYHGLTLRQLERDYEVEFMNDMDYLKKCRLRYLADIAPLPLMKINFYVEGRGGLGKGLISKAIARAIVDPTGQMDDNDIFLEISADSKVLFEKYDGQPVIIWNDFRAWTLMNALGGRENTFNVFDPFQTDLIQNIKYGSVRLVNSINIVNSVDPWDVFIDTLSGEYTTKDGVLHKAEDKGQGARRFPFLIPLHEEDYDIMMNKGVFDGTREYDQYYIYRNFIANFQRIKIACGGNLELTNKYNQKAVLPVTEKYVELTDKLSSTQIGTEEELDDMFKDLGTSRGGDNNGEVYRKEDLSVDEEVPKEVSDYFDRMHPENTQVKMAI